MNKLIGKNCLITGTNRGLGNVILEEFAEEGCSIIWAHARKKDIDFEENVKEISHKFQVDIRPIYFDLTEYTEMKDCIVTEIMKNKLSVDVLVNNAGVAHGGYFRATPVKDIEKIFDTNLFSVMNLTQLIAKFMFKNRCGSIINISSIAGIDLDIGNCAYGLSKAALISLTTVMAKEFTPYGIRVNSVAPGLLETDMAKEMEEKAYQEMISHSLMKRLGKPKEVAKVVTFLASDDASFISGQTIRVDGGTE